MPINLETLRETRDEAADKQLRLMTDQRALLREAFTLNAPTLMETAWRLLPPKARHLYWTPPRNR